MKVKVIHEERNIPLSEIAEELKKGNIVDRFEYGDYDNWVTVILKEVTVDKVEELGPKAIKKYAKEKILGILCSIQMTPAACQ